MSEIKQGHNARRIKSRSGCKACKARRIKCDETSPSCRQCLKRKAQCPGYTQVFTWSRRHERLGDVCGSKPVWPQSRGADGPSETTQTRASLRPILHRGAIARHSAAQTTSPTPLPRSVRLKQKPGPGDSLFSTRHRIFNEGFSSLVLHHYSDKRKEYVTLPQESYCDGESSQTDRTLNPRYEEPSLFLDTTLYSPAFELNYFGTTICHHLFICDTDFNPARKITVAKVRSSALYTVLLKYLIAEFHNKANVTNDARDARDRARADTQVHLVRANYQKDHDPSELLLAAIMFGMSTSWNGTNDTGVYFYRWAISMNAEIQTSMPRPERDFYSQTLIYWWSGLAFVVDPNRDGLLDPPTTTIPSSLPTVENIQDHQKWQGPTVSWISTFNLHPLTGLSLQSFFLLGKVGALVYTQRRLALECLFSSDIFDGSQEDILLESRRLEQILQCLQLPHVTDEAGTSSLNTSVAELCNIAEAQRLCALLLLYRCFPDVLRSRIAYNEDQEQFAMEQYMHKAALQALEVIEKNGISSRTRSVEQLLLVIVAGELKYPTKLHTTSGEVSKLFLDELSNGSTRVTSEYHHSWELSTQDDTLMLATHEGDRILGARALVCTRMSAVRNHLPYRSVEQAENLIWSVWWEADMGKEVFWMDLMIQNGEKFVMI